VAETTPSTKKKCVTCEYWQGRRGVSMSQGAAEFGSGSEKGECVGGGWDGFHTAAMSTCYKWKKWSLLN